MSKGSNPRPIEVSREQYANSWEATFGKKKEIAIAEQKTLIVKAGTKGVYLQTPDNHQPFIVVEDTLPGDEFIQVMFDSLPDEPITSPVKLSDVVFMRQSSGH